MKEVKTVSIPIELLDDPLITPVEVVVLAQILRFQSEAEGQNLNFPRSKIELRFTVNGLNQVLNLSKNTIRKGLLKLAEKGYLTTLPDNKGWIVNEFKSRSSEGQNLNFPRSKIELPEVKICSKEERTKEESIDKLYWCNNNSLIRDTGLEDIESCSILTDSKDTVSVNIESETILTTPENNDKDIAKQGACASAGARVREGEPEDRSMPDMTQKSVKNGVPAGKSDSGDPNAQYADSIREIIAYLNEKTGKHFSPKSGANQRHIIARLKEGYSLEDFKRVIDVKWFQWHDDDKMSQYLRPMTLFGSKFDAYLNEEFRTTRVGPNGWEYIKTNEPDILDEIFGGPSDG